ncbi:ABC transporter ATP-binding protein [Vibrio sp. HA2012]|uniref:ABC transporter ATP-binding protein n=1 Tax=Vibrio sp. HA2012 TaxID=1971595 RepID=UPI000C2CA8D7|nr:ATP-binding cassette domain-containing protein [Vibrio sp. HA2012]PJC86668.1 ABC transporter ATP-binding protein [Vibrio sp. HA2012]
MNNVKRLMIKDLNHSFEQKTVLQDINIELQQGAVMAVVGRSGCGKSTLLNLISGLIEVEGGDIVNDFMTTAILFQEPRLLPWKNTIENIGWGLKALGVCHRERELIASELAMEVGLEHDDLEKYPHELSGGMKQRVAMARSFAVKPELLLMDEPFSALDIGLKEDLYSLLINEIEQRELTVLFITHDIMEAVRLADQILVLDDNPGRQVYTYQCDKPRAERQQEYWYTTAMNLLQKEVVNRAFQIRGNND